MSEITNSGTVAIDALRVWWWFWTASFVVSGVCFFTVVFIVLFRGMGEIKEMIAKVGRKISQE